MQALRHRCAQYAADGRFELFKTSKKFDADESRKQHGFPTQAEAPTWTDWRQFKAKGKSHLILDNGSKDFALSPYGIWGLEIKEKICFFLSCEFGGLQPIWASVKMNSRLDILCFILALSFWWQVYAVERFAFQIV